MKELVGHTIKDAKEVAKKILGTKRMGESRFQLILDEGIRNGDFIIKGDQIVEKDFLDELDELFLDVELPDLQTKIPHPQSINSEVKKGDLPRPGDMYYYRSYSGEVVQGEVISVIYFAECQNPDGTWQTNLFQDLFLKKKGVPTKRGIHSHNAYYRDNERLRIERDRLLEEIGQLKRKRELP